MGYKSILVHMDDGKHCAARLAVAVDLAQRFGAHLIGLHALSAIPVPGYVATEIGVRTLAEIEAKARNASAARAEAEFNKAVAGAQLPGSEWRTADNDAVPATILNARYADVVVLGQPGPDDESSINSDFIEHVVLGAGRPAVIVPYAGTFTTVGKRVLVAWNGGREAVRALTDAIPVLREAERVHLMVFNRRSNGQNLPGADMGLYLARHGVEVEVSVQASDDVDVGNQILSRVADLGIDLIVMGAYGHSRMREMVLGGVTRTIFESMTAPVMMSH